MPRYKYLLFTGCILYLITAIPATIRPVEIKCEKNATGYYVCTNTTLTYLTNCCYNYELNYYYCCPHIGFRSQSYTNRLIGLIVAAVVIITLVCLLCLFFERCPMRWYLKKCMQRGSNNAARGAQET